MKFTPGQAQEILRLSPATFRHWKGALPPLGGRNGYAPCFTLGDLLAMAVVKILTEDVAIRVGSLHALALELFEHCARNSWAGLERMTLIIELAPARVSSIPETQPVPLDGLAISIPLRPLISVLRARLLLERAQTQHDTMRFPPTAIARTRRR